MIEQIHIAELEIHANVGVEDSERAQMQRLVLNLTLWPHIGHGNDELTSTIDYSEVAERVRKFTSECDCKLIETLGERIATDLLQRFGARKVAVEVRKFVLRDTNYVSVTAIRENSATRS